MFARNTHPAEDQGARHTGSGKRVGDGRQKGFERLLWSPFAAKREDQLTPNRCVNGKGALLVGFKQRTGEGFLDDIEGVSFFEPGE